MFKNAYQKGKFFTIFDSIGSKPLSLWKKRVQIGHCKEVRDDELYMKVLELLSSNVTTCFISTPCQPYNSLGITLPCITFVIKNLDDFFTFEIEVRDSDKQLRRFQASNFLVRSRFDIFITQLPLRLESGWNKIEIDLADFTRRTHRKEYVETVRIRVNANVRLRRIYFSDRFYTEDEKPDEYRLNGKVGKKSILV